MSSQQYCLRWNNYQSNMTTVFHQLLEDEAFVDVTLACNDLSLKAHKVVLSACSSYFQKLLLENPCKHPTIIMPQDVCYADLKFIIEFVYKGEIDVSQEELQSILRTADQLKIKGLCDPSEENDTTTPHTPPFSNKAYSKTRKAPSSPKNFKISDHSRKHKRRRHEKETEIDKEDKDNQEELYCVLTDEEDNDMPESLDDDRKKKEIKISSPKPSDMSLLAGQTIFSQFGVDNDDFPPEPPAPTATPVGNVDMQEHSPTRTLLSSTPDIHRTDLSDSHIKSLSDIKKEVDIKFETLRGYDQDPLLDMDASHLSGPDHSMDSHDDTEHGMHTMMITPELMGMMPTPPGSRLEIVVTNKTERTLDIPMHIPNYCVRMLQAKIKWDGFSLADMTHRYLEYRLNGDEGVPDWCVVSDGSDGQKSNGHTEHVGRHGGGPKTWTQEDMDMALDALRNHNMSLTKASATYGIPSTTLWQRAHRLGIDTPKKEGPTKSWTEESLNSALEALRTGTISANKASKAYGIPSSTLYKIARREGIRLAAPFNAAPTTWSQEDLEKALESIRTGQTSVQKASTEYGIPTGTLYGRCKREGIELSRSNPTPWSEDAMGEALEAVRLGHMSINQAAIHFNLPYSSLYGRFKRGIRYDAESIDMNSDSQSQYDSQMQMDYANIPNQYQHQSNS